MTLDDERRAARARIVPLEVKIAIMQHFKNGGEIEERINSDTPFGDWKCVKNPNWDWSRFEYRIKPVHRYALARDIKEHIAGTPVTYNDKNNCWATTAKGYSNYILSCMYTETEESALKRLIADGWVKEA